jgi:hypothetical protein
MSGLTERERVIAALTEAIQTVQFEPFTRDTIDTVCGATARLLRRYRRPGATADVVCVPDVDLHLLTLDPGLSISGTITIWGDHNTEAFAVQCQLNPHIVIDVQVS